MAVAEAAKAVAARVMAPDKNNPYGQAQEFQQVVDSRFSAVPPYRLAGRRNRHRDYSTVIDRTGATDTVERENSRAHLGRYHYRLYGKSYKPTWILIPWTQFRPWISTGYNDMCMHENHLSLITWLPITGAWNTWPVTRTLPITPGCFNSDNDQNYLKLYKNNTVNVEIKSIHPFALDTSTDALRWRTYSVHLDRLIGPDSGRRDQVKRISYEVILAVRYQHIAGATELIRDNPLGFEACRYSRAQLIG